MRIMNYPATELRGIYLSFRLVRNLSGGIPDALCTLKAPTVGAGMTNKKNFKPAASVEEFPDQISSYKEDNSE